MISTVFELTNRPLSENPCPIEFGLQLQCYSRAVNIHMYARCNINPPHGRKNWRRCLIQIFSSLRPQYNHQKIKPENDDCTQLPGTSSRYPLLYFLNIRDRQKPLNSILGINITCLYAPISPDKDVHRRTLCSIRLKYNSIVLLYTPKTPVLADL